MSKIALTALIAFSIGGAVTLALTNQIKTGHINGDSPTFLSKLLSVEKDLATTRQELLGHTTFTDYSSIIKKSIQGQSKFSAAKVFREYVHVEHIQRSTLGIKSNATILVAYTVDYYLGFDLHPERFSVASNKSGITLTLSKPDLVASPSVNIISHEIPSTSVLIDEQAAVIALQQQLMAMAKQRAIVLKDEEAVIALCEKRLEGFLRRYLEQVGTIATVPAIRFVYR